MKCWWDNEELKVVAEGKTQCDGYVCYDSCLVCPKCNMHYLYYENMKTKVGGLILHPRRRN